MKAARPISILAALLLAAMPQQARAVTIDWVTVGNPGNAPDPATGGLYGAVAEEFRIMKFEFTNSLYAAFLNAVDPNGSNPNSIYKLGMGTSVYGGIDFTAGQPVGSKYGVKTNMGDKPVTHVSWFDAARVSNWLHNGAQTYGSTDASASAPQNTGAYTLGTATSGNAVMRNVGALVSIPTENQWYKAAYYNPSLNGGTGGYRTYGNGFDTAPATVSASASGVGAGGSTGNRANYDNGAFWNGQQGNVTTVGTNGGASHYGAFDMSGNVFEWNDLNGTTSSSRGIRGGDFAATAFVVSSSLRYDDVNPSSGNTSDGFRLASPARQPVPPVTIDWVTVGDPGNAADTTGYGAVAEEFRIGKYEVTIQQYTNFLNSVAQSDPYSLYNPNMAENLNVAGISRSGFSGSYVYGVIGSGDRPVTYVSWFDAARFANWMHNGQGSGDTEAGAYTLNGATSGDAPAVNPGAEFSIPTENEWYKAAYSKGGGPDSGYWDYATQSDTAPGNVIGGGTNQANYDNGVFSVTQSAVFDDAQNYLTDVGAFTNSGSFYGTFDQSGNVWEWNDLDGLTAGSSRGLRGGTWIDFDVVSLSSSSSGTSNPANENASTGFRLAAPVPEPSKCVMALAGLAGGRYLVGRRRKRACSAPVSGISATR